MNYPNKILHWINNTETESRSGKYFDKYNPATGQILSKVVDGSINDVELVMETANKAFLEWSNDNIIYRSLILRRTALLLEERKEEIAEIIAVEGGKSKGQAMGEVVAAIECGLFFAGEGRRYYGKTLSSSVVNRSVSMIRDSIGAGVLIVPFNSPMASIAWKVFPALLCGNSVVLKSNEYTPYIAIYFAKIFKEAGLPSGIFSVLQGAGSEIGSALVSHPSIQFVGFTGSSATASSIIKATADRLTKVSIEAGGKNPMVICDDADLERAVNFSVSSAFVDGGQRCASASRLIILAGVYDKFKEMFLEKVKSLTIGTDDNDTFGAIISESHFNRIMDAVNGAVSRGAKLLCGGKKIECEGYFLEATVLEDLSPDDEFSQNEIFGPVIVLYKADNFNDALKLANNSKYKLSGAIHTKNMDLAQIFIKNYKAGVVRVNGPTYGSEPHMPFGGPGLSGNGFREPGELALDFYSEWKQVSIDYNF